MNYRALAISAFTVVCCSLALAQDIYVASDNGAFGQLNVSTGAYTLINSPTHEIGGLGLGVGGGLFALGFDDNLYSVDGSGNETLVGATGVNNGGGFGMGGASDGSLYASGDQLITLINQTTGSGTTVGSCGFFTGACPAGDGAGNLYLYDNAAQSLFGISRSTGASTLIGNTGDLSTIDAMAWVNGAMYAVDFAGNIYTINTSTAALTPVATYNTTQAGHIFAAASVFGPVPEPAPFVALGLGALALIRRRRAI